VFFSQFISMPQAPMYLQCATLNGSEL